MKAEYLAALVNDVVANFEPRNERVIGNHRVAYTRDEALQKKGLRPYTLLTYHCFFKQQDGVYDLTRVDPEITAMKTRTFETRGPVLVDIEEWDVWTHQQECVANVGAGAMAWQLRRGQTTSVGIFRIVPRLAYWTAVCTLRRFNEGNARYLDEQLRSLQLELERNDEVNAQLGPYIDYYCPHCYVQYADSEQVWREWKWSAAYHVMEANRLAQGKPVTPIAWWTAQATGEHLSEQQYRESLIYLADLPNVDGVFLHTSGDEPPYDWRRIVLDVFN